MQRLLNTRTNTVHVARDKQRLEAATCGSLRYVSQARIQTISDEELRTKDAVERCGNCFEDTGGY